MILLLLAGCDPCVPLGDIEVADPFGFMPAENRAELDRGLSEFAAWSGRDTVCVDTIDVVDADTSDEWHARLWRYEGRIQLDATGDTRTSITHELCHALDFVEDIVPAHADLFDGSLVAEAYPWASQRTRKREVFAYLCDNGPEPAALQARLAAECGVEGWLVEARELVQEVAWPDAPAVPWREPDLRVEVGTERPWDAWPPEMSSQANMLWRGVAVRVGAGRLPRAGAIVAVAPLGSRDWQYRPAPLTVADVDDGIRLLPSDLGPLLVRDRDGATWVVDPDSGTTEPGDPLPVRGDDLFYVLAVVGGRALTHSSGSTELWLTEPDGSAAPLVTLDGQLSDRSLDEAGRLWAWTEAGSLWEVDLGTGSATVRGSMPPGFSFVSRVRLQDGQWLAWLIDERTRWPALALLDPATGTWRAPVDLCTFATLEDAFDIIEGGAAPWLLRYEPGGLRAHALTLD